MKRKPEIIKNPHLLAMLAARKQKRRANIMEWIGFYALLVMFLGFWLAITYFTAIALGVLPEALR